MTRVLHIVCDLSPGGAERLVLELCRRASPDIVPSVATVQGLGPLEPEFRAAGIAVLEGGRRRRSLGVRAALRLAAAVREADVVHTHLFAGDTWGRIAAVIAGHRAVLTTEHNVNRDETWQRGVKRALAPVSRRILCVSEAAARYAREVEHIKGVEVLYNGVDLSRYTDDGPLTRARAGLPGTRLLAVGRRVPQKGFDVLLDALPAGVELQVAGDGPFQREHPQVRWLGRREDVPRLLAASDVLVVPSRWEGFGLVAAEGLAAGVTVVASAVDGLVEVVGDAGVLVPPEDPVALRAALERVVHAPQLRADLGQRGRARAALHFDLAQTIRAYEAIYRELAAV